VHSFFGGFRNSPYILPCRRGMQNEENTRFLTGTARKTKRSVKQDDADAGNGLPTLSGGPSVRCRKAMPM
jgi:hypothetical protein